MLSKLIIQRFDFYASLTNALTSWRKG